MTPTASTSSFDHPHMQSHYQQNTSNNTNNSSHDSSSSSVGGDIPSDQNTYHHNHQQQPYQVKPIEEDESEDVSGGVGGGSPSSNANTPTLSPSGMKSTRDEEEPRRITVEKGQEPLGITIVEGQSGGIFVSHVTAGSHAAKCGLKYGDQLLEVLFLVSMFLYTFIYVVYPLQFSRGGSYQ